MILVQGIGMSGYVPLEGVVGLSHFVLDYFSGKFEYMFSYLLGTESRENSGFDVMRKAVSFAVVNYFDEAALSSSVHGLFPLFGYHRAGVVFPMMLFNILEFVMRLNRYHVLTYVLPRSGFDFHSTYDAYGFGQLVYTTAWAEYISVDFMKDSLEAAPLFLVQMLGRFEMPLPSFRCDELRDVLMR